MNSFSKFLIAIVILNLISCSKSTKCTDKYSNYNLPDSANEYWFSKIQKDYIISPSYSYFDVTSSIGQNLPQFTMGYVNNGYSIKYYECSFGIRQELQLDYNNTINGKKYNMKILLHHAQINPISNELLCNPEEFDVNKLAITTITNFCSFYAPWRGNPIPFTLNVQDTSKIFSKNFADKNFRFIGDTIVNSTIYKKVFDLKTFYTGESDNLTNILLSMDYGIIALVFSDIYILYLRKKS